MVSQYEIDNYRGNLQQTDNTTELLNYKVLREYFNIQKIRS